MIALPDLLVNLVCWSIKISRQNDLDYSSKAVANTLESEIHTDQCPYINEK